MNQTDFDINLLELAPAHNYQKIPYHAQNYGIDDHTVVLTNSGAGHADLISIKSSLV